MTYTPIPAGTQNWDVPVNAAFVDQDARITTNASDIAAKVSKSGDTMTGTLTNSMPGSTSLAFATDASGDAFMRFRVRIDGRLDWGSGAAGVDATLFRSGVGVLRTDGLLSMESGQSSTDFTAFTGAPKALRAGSAGGGLAIAEGSNARMGLATLNGTTDVVVSNTSITADTRIFLTTQAAAGTPGAPIVVSRVNSTSFTIRSTTVGDTSSVAFLLVEPN